MMAQREPENSVSGPPDAPAVAAAGAGGRGSGTPLTWPEPTPAGYRIHAAFPLRTPVSSYPLHSGTSPVTRAAFPRLSSKCHFQIS